MTAANETKVYGTIDPALAYSVSGLVNGDTTASLSGSLARAPGETVGAYGIGQGSLFDGNYAITYVGGVLNVTPASLTITVGNVSRYAGQTDPAFSASYLGLTNGDGPGVVSGLTISANDQNASTPVGTYAIVASGGTAENYVISYVPGVLTVGSILTKPGQLVSSSASILSQVVSSQIAVVSPAQTSLSLPAQSVSSVSLPFEALVEGLQDATSSIQNIDSVSCLKIGTDNTGTCRTALHIQGF